jgi:protein-L-isoaspartate(D-aspartate) O-methyltransferase
MSGTGATCGCCTSRRCTRARARWRPCGWRRCRPGNCGCTTPGRRTRGGWPRRWSGPAAVSVPGSASSRTACWRCGPGVMSRAASPSDLAAAARAAGIGDGRVLEAISATPRAGFVPGDYLTAAYRDEPIPIGHRQVTTQPSLSARMIESLHLAGGDHVLEIGTGLGFQTALLARLAAGVISIERWPDLADQARRNLARQGLGNAEVLAGDGSRGLPEGAPYDAILVSAAFRRSPRRWPPSSGSAAAWCSQSDRAAASRWCCSSVPHPGWSGGTCSPWPGSSGCTGATDSSPGPDRAGTSGRSHRRARACSPATCLRPYSPPAAPGRHAVGATRAAPRHAA